MSLRDEKSSLTRVYRPNSLVIKSSFSYRFSACFLPRFLRKNPAENLVG